MDYFDKHYPIVVQLYHDYINRTSPGNSIECKVIEEYTGKKLEKAEELYRSDGSFETQCKAQYEVLDYGAAYNEYGFVMGFTTAMRLMKEC